MPFWHGEQTLFYGKLQSELGPGVAETSKQ